MPPAPVGPEDPLVRTLDLHRARETGWLRVELPGGGWSLALVGGRLHTAAGESPPADIAALAGEEQQALAAFSAADGIDFRRTEAEELGAVGEPLPVVLLLAEASVHERDAPALWARLGGRHVLLKVAGSAGLDDGEVRRLVAGAHDLLARLLQPSPAIDIVGDGEGAGDRLRSLVQLLTLGLVERLEPEAQVNAATPPARTVELFLERVGRDLESRPVSASPEQQRQRLAEILRNLGVWSHYELLDVGRHDGEAEIHRGYVAVAKMAHPSQASRLGLDAKDVALRTIFEAATQAYLVLSHPDRRREYDRDLGGGAAESPSGEDRQAEKAGIAREMFQRARRMMLQEQFQSVLELMQQAIQLDPQAEYYQLLGEVQMQNREWVSGAAGTLREAVRLRPDDADLRFLFARALEAAGDAKQAGIQYRAALELRPDHEDAHEHLESFEATTEPERRSLLDSVRSLFGRRG
ncbi:MAG: DnaJ domain-containing protein [Thermoanaerobaculia bacterium]|nr:DnaJ domain-containing protein [Thermoanaerobaculia bacterium]